MKPAAVFEFAKQAGVTLCIGTSGRIKAKGRAEQIDRLAPLIREYKAELLAYLQGENNSVQDSVRSNCLKMLNVKTVKDFSSTSYNGTDYIPPRSPPTDGECGDSAQPDYMAELQRLITRPKDPYLDDQGRLCVPLDCENKYRWWQGGQSVFATLLELGASNQGIEAHVGPVSTPDDWQKWQEIKTAQHKRIVC